METKRVNLALQGGGSHGAFTWGVLDRLLEDGRLEFDGISGTSAGAMNAVVLADGWLDALDRGTDPRDGARAALRDFWDRIGAQPGSFALAPPWAQPTNPLGLWVNPAFVWLDLVTRAFSPYQLNPLNVNPLRDILDQLVDFPRLRQRSPVKLFICATQVRTGRARVFRETELVRDMVLASACLPFTFQAVELDEGAFWDGGYSGNPSLFPLYYRTSSTDILLVQINPLHRDEVPKSAGAIIDRVNEISFNASLLQEMRAFEFAQRLLREERLDPQRYRRQHFHMIGGESLVRYDASTKYDTRPDFLAELCSLGRKVAGDWLDLNFEYIGHASSLPIAEVFL